MKQIKFLIANNLKKTKKMNKTELESEVVRLEDLLAKSEKRVSCLERTLFIVEKSLSSSEKENTRLEEEVKDLKIDFENTEDSVKKLIDSMKGKSWRKIISFTKQLTANVNHALEIVVEKQKNNYLFNQKQLKELKEICSDIKDGTVAFEIK